MEGGGGVYTALATTFACFSETKSEAAESGLKTSDNVNEAELQRLSCGVMEQ